MDELAPWNGVSIHKFLAHVKAELSWLRVEMERELHRVANQPVSNFIGFGHAGNDPARVNRKIKAMPVNFP